MSLAQSPEPGPHRRPTFGKPEQARPANNGKPRPTDPRPRPQRYQPPPPVAEADRLKVQAALGWPELERQRQQQHRAAIRLLKNYDPAAAERVAMCRRANNDPNRYRWPCHHRLCPYCMATKQHKWAKRNLATVEAMRYPLHITLNGPFDYPTMAEASAATMAAFGKLRRRVYFTRNFPTSLYTQEIAQGGGRTTFAHLHLIVDNPRGLTAAEVEHELRGYWLDYFGGPHPSHILGWSAVNVQSLTKRTHELLGTLSYFAALRYFGKTPNLYEIDPTYMWEWACWARGKRMYSTVHYKGSYTVANPTDPRPKSGQKATGPPK